MPRIHRSTWIVLAIVAAALVLANVPGHRRLTTDATISMFQPAFSNSLVERFEHGWPWVYLQRETSTYSCGFPDPVSAWHLGQPVRWFHWPAFAANLLVVGVVCAVVATLWERRCRRRKLWQISILDGLAITTFIAAICGYAMFQFDAARREAAALRIVRQSQYTGFGSTASSVRSEDVWPSAFTELAFETPPAALTRVAEVYVSDAKHLQYLPEFRQLQLVRISPDVTTADLQPLAACKSLRVLCFTDYSGLGGGLMGAYYDDLDDLPASQPLEIPAFRQLEQFSISKPNYHGAGLEHFKNLTMLNLANCSIDDEDMSRIGAMSNLVYLDLSGTRVTDAGLAQLAQLQRLEHLYLPAQTTDAGVRHLAGLNRLHKLNLIKSQVTDETLVTLQHLTSLSDVHLNQTAVSAEGVRRLSAALPRSAIYQDLVGEKRAMLGGEPTDEKVLYGRELEKLRNSIQ